DPRKIGARTLFATHYHELTSLESELSGVKNYNIAVKKRGDQISFLRKIVPGGADDSYGIEVALLAGLPNAVISRSKAILASLEGDPEALKKPSRRAKEVRAEEEMQITFAANGERELAEDLKKTNIDTMTPLEAMNTLYAFIRRASEI
ncbi:MAG: DNA mismatch repair protein MutS, partial [Clostridia bacterium]|nr:DNA mismatch repair protein MutS [Clostridia bacterium]